MTVLHENDQGWISVEGNELTIGSKIDDPPKLRLVSPITAHGGGGGCISFNAGPAGRVCGLSEQREMALDRVEQADDVRGNTSSLRAERNFQLNDGSGSNDAAMRKPLAFVWNAVTRSLLSVLGGPSDTIWSPDGLTFTQMQSDGNLVKYTTSVPYDKVHITSAKLVA